MCVYIDDIDDNVVYNDIRGEGRDVRNIIMMNMIYIYTLYM